MKSLTSKRLREVLSYCKETGEFRWLVANSFRVKVGDLAGSTSPNGYRHIGVDGTRYYAHRLAWLFVKGHWPAHHIDHINGNPIDNRIVNLRECSQYENMQNVRSYSNVHGLIGAHYCRKTSRWYSRIKSYGVTHFLGYFSSKEEAHLSYMKAKANLHPFRPDAEKEAV